MSNGEMSVGEFFFWGGGNDVVSLKLKLENNNNLKRYSYYL